MGWGSHMDGCGNCMKYCLFIINLIIFVGGIIVVALGIWTIVDKSFANELLGTNLYSGAVYVLIATGILISLLSCFGCFGAVKEVRCMLVTYFILVFLIFLTMLVGGILGYVFREKVSTTMRNSMYSSLRSYGNNRPITEAWDETQSRLHCCGIYSYRDWQNNIPDSCCEERGGKRQPCQSLVEQQNSFTLYQKGCLNVTTEYIKDHAAIIGGAGIAVACLMGGEAGDAQLVNQTSADSITSVIFPWRQSNQRRTFVVSSTEMGRGVSANGFFLCTCAVLLIISTMGLCSASVWSMIYRIPYIFLTEGKAYHGINTFSFCSGLLNIPACWVAWTSHNNKRNFVFLPLLVIILVFAIIMSATSITMGFITKGHMVFDRTQSPPKMLPSYYRDILNESMHETMSRYKVSNKHRLAWDVTQNRLHCCGVTSYMDWLFHGRGIPESCSVNGTRTVVYKAGCLDLVAFDLYWEVELITGFVFITVVIQVVVVILASFLYF